MGETQQPSRADEGAGESDCREVRRVSAANARKKRSLVEKADQKEQTGVQCKVPCLVRANAGLVRCTSERNAVHVHNFLD